VGEVLVLRYHAVSEEFPRRLVSLTLRDQLFRPPRLSRRDVQQLDQRTARREDPAVTLTTLPLRDHAGAPILAEYVCPDGVRPIAYIGAERRCAGRALTDGTEQLIRPSSSALVAGARAAR
jgi:hypothetical protein